MSGFGGFLDDLCGIWACIDGSVYLNGYFSLLVEGVVRSVNKNRGVCESNLFNNRLYSRVDIKACFIGDVENRVGNLKAHT
jgi:hypothetical protein